METVVLVHGTGAGVRSETTAHWWQANSAFSNELTAHSRGRLCIDDDFVWGNGGENSERARREAGRHLARKLVQLEQEGRIYHLIGHSHGGSVIWHAFLEMTAVSKEPEASLPGMKSWATLGTPFLTFRPRLLSLCWTAASIATFFLAWPLFSSFKNILIERSILWAELSYLEIAQLTIPLIALAVVFVCGIKALISVIISTYDYVVRQKLEVRAALAFQGRWRGYTHPQDEAVNALGATMCAPPQMAPRFHRFGPWTPFVGRSNFLRQGLDGISIVAKALDEGVWSLLMRKAQGADFPGLMLDRVGTSPNQYFSDSALLPDHVQASLNTLANSSAASSLAIARSRLSLFARSTSAKSAFATLVTPMAWDGVLHTSYYNIEEMKILLFDGLSGSGAQVPDQHAAQKPAGNNSDIRNARRFASSLPNMVAAISITVLMSISAFSYESVFQSHIEPWLRGTQIALVADYARRPGAFNVQGNNGQDEKAVTHLFRALAHSERVTRKHELLTGIGNQYLRRQLLQDLSFEFAKSGQFETLKQFIDFEIKSGVLKPEQAKLLGYLYASLAKNADSVEGNRLYLLLKEVLAEIENREKVPHCTSDPIQNQFFDLDKPTPCRDSSDTPFFDQDWSLIRDVLLPPLIMAHSTKRGAPTTGQIAYTSNCKYTGPWVDVVALSGRDDLVASVLGSCTDTNRSGEIARRKAIQWLRMRKVLVAATLFRIGGITPYNAVPAAYTLNDLGENASLTSDAWNVLLSTLDTTLSDPLEAIRSGFVLEFADAKFRSQFAREQDKNLVEKLSTLRLHLLAKKLAELKQAGDRGAAYIDVLINYRDELKSRRMRSELEKLASPLHYITLADMFSENCLALSPIPASLLLEFQQSESPRLAEVLQRKELTPSRIVDLSCNNELGVALFAYERRPDSINRDLSREQIETLKEQALEDSNAERRGIKIARLSGVLALAGKWREARLFAESAGSIAGTAAAFSEMIRVDESDAPHELGGPRPSIWKLQPEDYLGPGPSDVLPAAEIEFPIPPNLPGQETPP